MAAVDDALERSAAALAAARTPFDLFSGLCRELVVVLDASSCTISRRIGDLLIQLTEHVPEGPTLHQGQGFLVSDFPLTGVVIDQQVTRQVSLDDPAADPHEAALLRVLGYRALLMLPFVADGDCWGLVEVYDTSDRTFTHDDIARATALVGEAARLLCPVLAAKQRQPLG